MQHARNTRCVDLTAIDLLQQVGDIGSDELHHFLVARFRGRKAGCVQNRLFSPHRIPAT